MKPGDAPLGATRRELESAAAQSAQPNLKDPAVVLTLLEEDQTVAAKRQTRFGRRNLSPGVRVLLWGLRVYVAIMLVLVLISVLRIAHVLH